LAGGNGHPNLGRSPLNMTFRLTPVVLCLAAAWAVTGLAPSAAAKAEEWKPLKGDAITAEPSDVVGPWALFDSGAFLPLNLLSPEDCVRFYQALQGKPARADNWAHAGSAVSAELYGRLMRYSGNDLVPDSENGRKEPEFYLVFFTDNDRNKSWNMLSGSTPALYAQLIKDYPDDVQGFVFGVGEVLQDHYDIATNTHGEWMFTNFDTEVEMRTLKKMIPSNFYGLLLVTRDGIPLVGPEASTDEDIKASFVKVNAILKHAANRDTRDWRARAYYYRAVQPVAFAHGHSDPLLIGNPLVAARLRQMKIYQVDATFKVAADGTITGVDVKPGTMTPDTVKMFATGFQRGCLFVPAVDNGKFVDGTYEYHMQVAP
jgi:hypothetical protein